MPLTQEQRDKILNNPNFAKLAKKPEVSENAGLTMRERREKAKELSEPVEGKGFFSRVKERIGEREETIEEKAGMQERGEISTFSQIVNFASQGFGALGDTAFEALVSATPEVIKDKAKELGSNVLQTDIGKSGLEAAKAGVDAWEGFKQEHPEIATNIESLVNFAEIIPAERAASLGVKATKEAVETGVKLAKRTAKEISEGVGEVIKEAKEPIEKGFKIISKKAKDISEKKPLELIKEKARAKTTTLEETVSPKFNISEKIKAIREKRIKTGEDFPGLGKAPDIIEPSKSTKKISDTLRKYIDDVEDLDQFQIVEQADNITTELAKEIRPTLKELPFTSGQKKELFSEWDFIKKQQADSAFFDSAVTKRFQENTSKFLEQINKRTRSKDGKLREWTMNDLWDFRIAYDNLADVKRIKKLLKKTDLTGEEQLLIDMWLENRNMLNQFIKDEAQNIGGDVGAKWADMSDMYEVIDNISSKADIDLTGEPDIIRQFITIPTKIIR